MATIGTAGSSRDSSAKRAGYGRVPLIQLAMGISQWADHQALRELHANRSVFRNRSNQLVVLAEFLADLRDRDITFQWCGRDPVVVDQAYDLTLSKFLNLPSQRPDGRQNAEHDGPDCRHYYRAFCNHAAAVLKEQPAGNLLDRELRAATLLQTLVTRHFYLSCLECWRRAQKLVRRYRWQVDGASLLIWLPVEMSGRRCRRWLETNFPDVDPKRPGERDRLQGRVDRLLARRRVLSLDRLSASEGQVLAHHSRPQCADDISIHGLAAVVAGEKAENLEAQRPSIKVLGGPTVKRLVETVFESLATNQHKAETIARTFGLSKATFSRFAGCHWRRDSGASGESAVPDLWRNTAHILASCEEFVAVARQAGVWDRVRRVIGDADSQEGEVK